MSDTFSQPIVKYGYEQNYRFKPTDDEWGDTAGRVVDALLKPDEDHPRYAQLRRRAYDAIYNRRFLPGGRVIANAGTSYDKATMINCLSAETEIVTREGLKEIGSLAGGTATVLSDNGSWIDAPISSFGVQDLMKVTFKRGGREKVVYATPEHEWPVRTRKTDKGKVQTKNLKTAEENPRSSTHRVYRNHSRGRNATPSKVGIMAGLVYGDGSKRESGGSYVRLYGESKDLAHIFPEKHEQEDYIEATRLPSSFKEEPNYGESSSFLLGWLMGYFAADGCCTTDGEYVISSYSKESIEAVRNVCSVLGLDYFSVQTQERKSNLNEKEVECHSIRLDRSTVPSGFLLLDKHKENATEGGHNHPWRVMSVERTDRREEVYCATVPNESHTFTLEGNLLTSNCYVSGPRKDEHDIDSIDSIYRELERCAKILASEGGYGFNADWMRPRGAVIRGSGARTPGAVEMLNLWDQTSHTLTKGPEMENDREDAKEKIRKGAMMVTMSLWHPDVREFITAKQEAGRLSKFNMSVLVSDKFMEAVEAGDDWYFVYPDYEKAESRYEAEWDGNIRKWSEKGLPMKTYDSIPARDLWNEIMQSTYERNEPGVLFVDTINDRNPLYYEEHIKATNACSEWPMPPGGTCNLTNLVLPRYVGEEGDIDYEQMSRDIHMAVRLGDNVNDVAYVPFERQQKELQQKRRIGLGHMGFGSMCAMRGIRYGSERSVEFARSLQRFITNTAYQASAKLAYEKEPFPLYDEEKHVQGDMHQRLNNDTRLMIEKYGLRNSHLLSIQPTGNTSILAGSVSGGLEPIFSAEYTRTVEWPMLPDEIDRETDFAPETQGDEEVLRCTKDGYEEWQIHPTRGIVRDVHQQDYALKHGGLTGDEDWFVTAMELDVDEHVAVMEAFAEYVDSSMSKTINIPSDYPFEDFKDLYKQMWETGLIKGGTTYRAGSMSAVLKTDEDEEEEEPESQHVGCAECDYDGELQHQEGCVTCPNCGWSKCEI
jgi:adenosylcobalamin-dependent ribonucleoside-diphosphate reductase